MNKKLPRIEMACQSCGSIFLVNQSQLDRGRGRFCSRSCGVRFNQTKHGHTTKTAQSGTYSTWANMMQRCYNAQSTNFHEYGALGIDVDPKWHTFVGFLSDMGERPAGKTLDRVDGLLGYSKANCRWATPKQQQRNIRSNVRVTYGGTSYPISALAEMLGVPRSNLQYRIKRGWPEDKWGVRAFQHRAAGPESPH